MSESGEQTTAVLEATTAATPASRYQSFAAMQASAHERLADLEAARQQQGFMSLDDTVEVVALERWLADIQPELERLRHEALYAQALIDVEGIKADHDAHIAAKADCHERIAQAYSELFLAFKALEVLHNQQIAPLERLRRPGTHEPAIPVRTGAEVARDVASTMPGAMGLHMLLFEATSRPLTNGDLARMKDADPGLRALNPRILSRYLAGLRA